MRASMAAASGPMAAPQIGESVRLVIFEVAAARATEAPDDGPVDMTVLFNPTWEVLDDRQALGWEGCLSLPGMRGEVPRYRRIRYHGWGLGGAPIRRIAGGFHRATRTISTFSSSADGLGLLGLTELGGRHPGGATR